MARDGSSEADRSDEEMRVRMAGWYAGDLRWAHAAVLAHQGHSPAEVGASGPVRSRGSAFAGAYGGDLAFVLANA